MKDSLQIYLKEQADHGTPDFPIGFYPCLIPRDFQNLPVHWHEELEITRIGFGTLDYVIDMAPFRVREGDLLLIAPNTLHGAHELSGQRASTDSIVFHLDMVRSCLSPDGIRRYLKPLEESRILPPVIHPGENGFREMNSCFGHLWDCRLPDAPFRELKAKEELLRFLRLSSLLSSCSVPSDAVRPGSPYEEKLKTVLAYIKAHYSEQLTMAQLAELCGFSEIHFMNIFKKSIGTSCGSYIIEYRLAMAAVDLRETDGSILQIALDNGFRNISYFNRSFKKRYQMTPSEYRKIRLAQDLDDA